MGRRLVQRRAAEEDVAEQLAYIAAERPAVAHRYAIAHYRRTFDLEQVPSGCPAERRTADTHVPSASTRSSRDGSGRRRRTGRAWP